MYWLGWFRSLRQPSARHWREDDDDNDLLFERVCDQREDLLVLVQQQHGPQVTQALVSEARGGQQLQTFNLAEVRPLTKGEEVQQLGDIVSPAHA